MKNLQSILLVIASTALLSSYDVRSAAQLNSVPPSPSTQPNNRSNPIIDPKLLGDYQNSQERLTKLLDDRVKNKNDNIKLQKTRKDLIQELSNFQKLVASVEQAAVDTPSFRKISEIKKIIIFYDLTSPEKVKELQAKLNLKNLGQGEGVFGPKTKTALVEKIREFGKELEVLSKPTIEPNQLPSSPSPSPSPTQSPVPSSIPSNFSWLSSPFFIFSLTLTITISTIIIYGLLKQIKQQHEEIRQLKENNKRYLKAPEKVNDLSKIVDNVPKQSIENSSSRDGAYHVSNLSSSIGKNEDISSSKLKNQSYDSSNREVNSPSRQSSFITDYNEDIVSFYRKYQNRLAEVLEAQYHIEGRRSGIIKTINLSLARPRDAYYWVLSQNNQHLVVPSEMRIHEHNQELLNTVFNYNYFNPNYRKILLVEPAMVEPQDGGGYQLVRRGRIEFA